MQPQEAANLICFLAHDCQNCPVQERDFSSMEMCKRNLCEWLTGQTDEDFWRYLGV